MVPSRDRRPLSHILAIASNRYIPDPSTSVAHRTGDTAAQKTAVGASPPYQVCGVFFPWRAWPVSGQLCVSYEDRARPRTSSPRASSTVGSPVRTAWARWSSGPLVDWLGELVPRSVRRRDSVTFSRRFRHDRMLEWRQLDGAGLLSLLLDAKPSPQRVPSRQAFFLFRRVFGRRRHPDCGPDSGEWAPSVDPPSRLSRGRLD